MDKLSTIEKKVIVGGVDLLKKSEEQERLLEESSRELEERVKKQEELRKELEERELEEKDIEEKYASLQEEAVGKTKKLKKVWSMLMSAKSEVGVLRRFLTFVFYPINPMSKTQHQNTIQWLSQKQLNDYIYRAEW